MSAPKSITLTLSGAEATGYETTHTFDLTGGTFGRSDESTWVIKEDFVSRHQGLIGFANGTFHVAADVRAKAPMLVNGVELMPPEKYPLGSGDTISIATLTLHVGLSYDFVQSDPRSRPRPAAPPPSGKRQGPFAPGPAETHPPYPGLQPVELDVDKLMGGAGRNATQPPARRPEDFGRDVKSTHMPPLPRPATPPSTTASPPTAAPDALSADWLNDPRIARARNGNPPSSPMPDASFQPAPEPTSRPAYEPVPQPTYEPSPPAYAHSPDPVMPTSVPRPAPPPRQETSTADLAAFLRGAGLEGETLDPQVLATLGGMLRVVIEGVIAMIRARNEIRQEFRLPVTMAGATENNPLKFSANAQDALYDILVKRDPAYLAALPAFEEAFEDLCHHELAMLKGLHVAYTHMLSRFDPQRLQPRFEAQAKASSFAGIAGRPRTWEQYCAWFAEQTEDEAECFRRLFGDHFGKSYEQELERLARLPRKPKTND